MFSGQNMGLVSNKYDCVASKQQFNLKFLFLIIDLMVTSPYSPFVYRTPLNEIIANTEDPDEIPQNALFHRCLHCLLRQSRSSELDIYYILEIVTCDPSMYTIDKSDFLCSCSVLCLLCFVRVCLYVLCGHLLGKG